MQSLDWIAGEPGYSPKWADLSGKAVAVIALIWTLLVCGVFGLHYYDERAQIRKLAANEARAAFNKDLAIRHWATAQGGVYVPSSRKTPPNPYLSHIPDRDIKLASGKVLTLMNPAYMLKQIMSDYGETFGIKGRITSLKPLNPGNAPDDWERVALMAFERGAREVTTLAEINDQPYFRLMQPMLTREGCLKCHAFQGYREGDIRGGIGVSVPMTPYLELFRQEIKTTAPFFLSIWLTGLAVLAFGFVRARKNLVIRRQSEKEIKLLKNYLENIIGFMPAVLVGMDLEYTVTLWNRAAETVTGIPAGDAVGKSITDVIPDFSTWIMALHQEISPKCFISKEKLLSVKDGERRFYDLMLYSLAINGVTEGLVARIDDVTERTRIQEILVHTEKMISIGGLAAGMAHEINNPLGIISQAAQNIERRVALELSANQQAALATGVNLDNMQAYLVKREIPVFLRDIREAAGRASNIVSNMLYFSRRSDLVKAPVDLALILEQSVVLAANDYDLKKRYDFKSIEIVREYEADVPPVLVAAVEIEQVFLNLLKNAAHAMAANPPLKKRHLAIRLRRDEQYAMVEIEDNGSGMDEKVRQRIFEPFFTTKEPGVGTGLGLSVSYSIITQNHKGMISVESTPGNGACFMVWLPLARPVAVIKHEE